MNRSSGQTSAELLERSVAALVREWGVPDGEARAAILRVQAQERRLGARLAAAARAADEPAPRVIDGAERARHPQLWRLYDDHGALVFGRVEGVLSGWSGRVA